MVYKNNIGKNICFALAYIVCLILCCYVFTCFDFKEYWSDYSDTNFELVTETDEFGNTINVNYISTPEQLAGFFEFSNKNAVSADDFTSGGELEGKVYKLKNDINLSGKTWTCLDLDSGYVFDGNNHTISNLTISTSSGSNIGFVAKSDGTIKNLFLKNISITYSGSSAVNIGGVCGYLSSGTIINCVITSGSISAKSRQDINTSTGGIVGNMIGGTVKNCHNHSTVSHGRNVGGIVGYHSSGKITNCYNYTKVNSTYLGEIYVGGVVGSSANGLSLCFNEGEVSATQPNASTANCCAGGIAGYTKKSISSCYNKGNVSSGDSTSSENFYAGGICGKSEDVISNCGNRGNVTANASEKEQPTSATNNLSSKTTNSLISIPFGGESEDTTTPSDPPGTDSGSSSSGGIKTSYTTIKKIYAKNAFAGGICGYSSQTASYCYNVGTILGGYRKLKFDLTHTNGYSKVPGGSNYGDRTSLVINEKYTGTVSFTTQSYASEIIGNKYSGHTSCYGIATHLPTDFTLSYTTYYTKNATGNTSEGAGNYSKSISNSGYNTWSDSGMTNGVGTVTGSQNFHGTNVGYTLYNSPKMDISYSNTKLIIIFSYSIKSGVLADAVPNSFTLVNESYTRPDFSDITNTAGIKNLSWSGWSKNSAVNDGYPYISGLYW